MPVELYDQEEMAGVLAFISVFYSSSDFWNSYNQVNKMGKFTRGISNINRDSDSADVILADAWGAFYGSFWGPIGSIVGGAALSLAIDDMNNGGY